MKRVVNFELLMVAVESAPSPQPKFFGLCPVLVDILTRLEAGDDDIDIREETLRDIPLWEIDAASAYYERKDHDRDRLGNLGGKIMGLTAEALAGRTFF